MKFVAIQSNIQEAIAVIDRAVGASANLPILKNILIKAENNLVSFIATNLEIATTFRASGKIIEDGLITVPMGLFSSIIGNIKSDRLNFEAKGNMLEIKTDNYNATVQGLAASDFPPGTPLNHFFAWNETAWWPDRRYKLAASANLKRQHMKSPTDFLKAVS